VKMQAFSDFMAFLTSFARNGVAHSVGLLQIFRIFFMYIVWNPPAASTLNSLM
jgi:hypothetical protein